TTSASTARAGSDGRKKGRRALRPERPVRKRSRGRLLLRGSRLGRGLGRHLRRRLDLGDRLVLALLVVAAGHGDLLAGLDALQMGQGLALDGGGGVLALALEGDGVLDGVDRD